MQPHEAQVGPFQPMQAQSNGLCQPAGAVLRDVARRGADFNVFIMKSGCLRIKLVILNVWVGFVCFI
jgi:hypothetical protein